MLRCIAFFQAVQRYRRLTIVRKDCGPKPTISFGGNTLRGETKERWRELCEQAVAEQDPDRFITTIEELLEVLEEREEIAAQARRRVTQRKSLHNWSGLLSAGPS